MIKINTLRDLAEGKANILRDVLEGTQYNLSTTLYKDQWYTLVVDGDFVEDDFIGVWLGTDKFIGYLNDNKMTFKANESYEDTTIIFKSLSGEGIVKNVSLVEGQIEPPWTPAPEDITETNIINHNTPFVKNNTIHSLKLYNRALTDEEILQNYQAGQCSPLLVMRGEVIG